MDGSEGGGALCLKAIDLLQYARPEREAILAVEPVLLARKINHLLALVLQSTTWSVYFTQKVRVSLFE